MRTVCGIVIHRGEVTAASREYHVLVMKDGTRVRLRPDTEKAPHARLWNRTTLGLCVFGDFAQAEPGANWDPTEAQYEGVIAQIREWRELYGPLWVKGHSELGSGGTSVLSKLSYAPDHSCPGLRFDLDRVR